MRERTLNDYWKVVKNNHKLLTYLHFNTEFGWKTLEEVALLLQNEQKNIVKEKTERQFLVAILMQQFELRIYSFEELGASICITKRTENPLSEPFGEFPPALFLKPFTEDITELGAVRLLERHIIHIMQNTVFPSG